MIILAIESSCDETAAAVLASPDRVLSDVVASQDQIHAAFGGVVPELASRAHMETVAPLIGEALHRAGKKIDEIDAVAATAGPGLLVCVLVGLNAAKGIALGLGIPLVGVNHLDGHLSAIFLDHDQEPPGFPHVGLVVSGGHTSLYLVKEPGVYEKLGSTLDDAAGESFDKCAKVLGLPYPGGREIEKLAATGDEKAIALPRPLLNRDDFDFSFSGLKTAVINHFAKSEKSDKDKADLAASFQAAAVEVLVTKSIRAALSRGAREIVVSGGVACNGSLRRGFALAGEKAGVRAVFPTPHLCTDNAAMIAAAGARLLAAGVNHGLELAPRAVWPL